MIGIIVASVLFNQKSFMIMTQYEWLLAQLETDTDDCIEWPYHLNDSGYGRVWNADEKRLSYVPRLALQIATGQDGEGLQAAHKPVVCHNPACFNPKHLEWKTSVENMRDKYTDGTANVGERHGSSKLTEEKVRLIVALWDSGNFLQKELAEIFGVSKMTMSLIVRRIYWKHLWV